MIALFLSTCPRAFWSMFMIKWLIYLRIKMYFFYKEKMLITLSSYISLKFIHVLYYMFKVNYRDRNAPAQRRELKGETRVNKKHTGTLLLFAKASAVKLHLCLCWTHTVATALRTVLDSRRYLSWKQSPVCLTLLLYKCEWRGGHDLSLMNSSTLYFPPAPCQSRRSL